MALLLYVFAAKAATRLYSYAVPWNWFVPDLVVTFTTPPPVRPYSAVKFDVDTRNSCTESSGTVCPTVASNRSTLSPPSSRTLVSAERCPLMAKPAPLALCMSSVTFPDVATRSYGLRVSVGRSVIWLLVTTCDSVWFSVFTTAVSFEAVTSTVVDVPVTDNCADTSKRPPTSRVTWREYLSKPECSMVSVYVVGGKFVMAYSPADAVVALRVSPVPVETTVTVAPGTTALLLSVTIPEMVADSPCAKSQELASSNTPSSASSW